MRVVLQASRIFPHVCTCTRMIRGWDEEMEKYPSLPLPHPLIIHVCACGEKYGWLVRLI